MQHAVRGATRRVLRPHVGRSSHREMLAGGPPVLDEVGDARLPRLTELRQPRRQRSLPSEPAPVDSDAAGCAPTWSAVRAMP